MLLATSLENVTRESCCQSSLKVLCVGLALAEQMMTFFYFNCTSFLKKPSFLKGISVLCIQIMRLVTVREPTLRNRVKCLEERESKKRKFVFVYWIYYFVYSILQLKIFSDTEAKTLLVHVSKKALYAVKTCTKDADKHEEFSF